MQSELKLHMKSWKSKNGQETHFGKSPPPNGAAPWAIGYARDMPRSDFLNFGKQVFLCMQSCKVTPNDICNHGNQSMG